MDWRVLVLIVSLLMNAYLFSSIRKLEFQAKELTQSASRQRRELSVIAHQLEQSINAAGRAADGLSEADLSQMIKSIAQSEVDGRRPNCSGATLRNATRLRSLQVRFRNFAANFDNLAKATAANEKLANPARIKELAAQLKTDVLNTCKR